MNGRGRGALMVEIKFYSSLREITGRETLKVRLKQDATLQEALERLVPRYGKKLRQKSCYEKNWVVMLNDKNIAFGGGMKTILRDGDRIAILSPLSGG